MIRTFNVFVSMSFRDKTKDDVARYLKFAENYFRNTYEYVRDEDIIIPVCAWYDDSDYFAPRYSKEQNKKLNDLSRALSLMAACDSFIMFTNADGSIPSGCSIELTAWVTSGDAGNLHAPIVVSSAMVKEDIKEDIYNVGVDLPKDLSFEGISNIKNRLKIEPVRPGVSEEAWKKIVMESNNKLPEKEKILQMFNEGASIDKIAKETGMSSYYVKKYIDAATSPDTSVHKANRILSKGVKAKTKEKKHRGGVMTPIVITCPTYLDKEVGDKILEETKIKYAGRYKYTSDLNKFYIRECKLEYIKTHYGNGYTMYDIGKVIGVPAATVQRLWNAYQRKEGII